MKKIEIYSTPTCTYCRHAKDFFKENGLEYTEYNVAADRAKLDEMREKTGQMGVPVIVIDGGEPIVGFDRDEIAPLLGVK